MRYRDIRGLGGDAVYRYTSSLEHDREIADLVALVASAHLLSLVKAGLIPPTAASRIASALLEALDRPEAYLSEGYEDAFEALEAWLSGVVGSGDAGWLPMGRSRNDQVSAVLRLYAARCAAHASVLAARLMEALLSKAEEYADILVPGYTHGRPSQAITGGCLFTAYAEAIADAARHVLASAYTALRSPLGASAGGGTLAPIDEAYVAGLLGFRETYWSSYYASGSRIFIALLVGGLAVLASELSRMAEDMARMSGPPTNILRLPASHLATSSIMPHKANPVTLEVVRAWASRILGDAAAISSMLIKLPYSYSLDLQEANPHLYNACRWASTALEALADLVPGIEVDREAARLAVIRAEPWSAEAAEYLALKENKPLRAAYSELARLIAGEGLGSALRRLGIRPEELVRQRRTGCTPSRVAEALGRARSRARSLAQEASALLEDLEASWRGIREALQELAGRHRGTHG